MSERRITAHVPVEQNPTQWLPLYYSIFHCN